MAEDDDREREPEPKPAGFSTLDGLQIAFGIAACSGFIFYVNGPAKNLNQTFFRLGVMAVGAIGLLIVTIIKLANRRR
jgi:hypothetical protein